MAPALSPLACEKLGAVLFEGVGDVFEEDEPGVDTLVLIRAPAFTQFGLFEAVCLVPLGSAAFKLLRRLPSTVFPALRLSAVRRRVALKSMGAAESLAATLGVAGMGNNGCPVGECHGKLFKTGVWEVNQGVGGVGGAGSAGGVGPRPRWLMAVLAR